MKYLYKLLEDFGTEMKLISNSYKILHTYRLHYTYQKAAEFNSLWPSDAMWCQSQNFSIIGSGNRVSPCFATNHYLDKCWYIVKIWTLKQTSIQFGSKYKLFTQENALKTLLAKCEPFNLFNPPWIIWSFSIISCCFDSLNSIRIWTNWVELLIIYNIFYSVCYVFPEVVDPRAKLSV